MSRLKSKMYKKKKIVFYFFLHHILQIEFNFISILQRQAPV